MLISHADKNHIWLEIFKHDDKSNVVYTEDFTKSTYFKLATTNHHPLN